MDGEVLFAAALLHDVGLVRPVDGVDFTRASEQIARDVAEDVGLSTAHDERLLRRDDDGRRLGGGWMMGQAGYQWMIGGVSAPGWMPGDTLPGFMMGAGAGTDPGKIMGACGRTPPGRGSARRRPPRSAARSRQAPARPRANTITFTGTTVRLIVLASPPAGATRHSASPA